MSNRRSKVSMIPDPIPHKKLMLREILRDEVAKRGLEQDRRGRRTRKLAKKEPRPEVRAALNDLADRHEASAVRADRSRWFD